MARSGRISFAQFKAFLASIASAGPGGVPGGASAIAKAVSASARAGTGSAFDGSSYTSTPASASSASATAASVGSNFGNAATPASAAGASMRLPHLARDSLLEGLFAYLDKDGDGLVSFRDVFVCVSVLRGLVRFNDRELCTEAMTQPYCSWRLCV